MDMSAERVLSPELVNENLPTPLYHQIYMVLRERILRGDFPAESMLPGEQELCRLLNVSRITVKRALNELADDRLVSRHRGRGTIVTGRPPTRVVRGSFDTLLEALQRMGLETQVELLEVVDRPANAHLADLLNIKAGDLVQRITRVRKIDGEPLCYVLTIIPAAIAAGYAQDDLQTRPILDMLDEIGAAPLETEQWITAVAAEPHVAAALLVDVGAPLLRIERITRDKRGRPIQIVNALCRSDRFEYHIRSKRAKLSAAKVGGPPSAAT